jgi:hypothetical protein
VRKVSYYSDTGADISLVKGATLIGSREYDPEGKVRVKSVNGSWIETHGKLSATIELMNSSITRVPVSEQTSRYSL